MNADASMLMRGLDERLARGVVAGIGAGLLFLLANMWNADSQDLPAVAPLYDISTIFYFTDKPDPVPENAAVGLVVHLALGSPRAGAHGCRCERWNGADDRTRAPLERFPELTVDWTDGITPVRQGTRPQAPRTRPSLRPRERQPSGGATCPQA